MKRMRTEDPNNLPKDAKLETDRPKMRTVIWRGPALLPWVLFCHVNVKAFWPCNPIPLRWLGPKEIRSLGWQGGAHRTIHLYSESVVCSGDLALLNKTKHTSSPRLRENFLVIRKNVCQGKWERMIIIADWNVATLFGQGVLSGLGWSKDSTAVLDPSLHSSSLAVYYFLYG